MAKRNRYDHKHWIPLKGSNFAPSRERVSSMSLVGIDHHCIDETDPGIWYLTLRDGRLI